MLLFCGCLPPLALARRRRVEGGRADPRARRRAVAREADSEETSARQEVGLGVARRHGGAYRRLVAVLRVKPRLHRHGHRPGLVPEVRPEPPNQQGALLVEIAIRGLDKPREAGAVGRMPLLMQDCLLYTSDAADE